MISKKKKKKKVFAKIQSDFSAEIRNLKVFSAQNQVISKKIKIKKVFTQGPYRFSPELTQISSQKPDAQLTKGGGGGHASILLTLLCNFAIPPKYAPAWAPIIQKRLNFLRFILLLLKVNGYF